LGIGDWGLGIGDWAQSPIPNPQSPLLIIILTFNSLINFLSYFLKLINKLLNKNYKGFEWLK